jgi:hypothetical protein
LRSWLVLVVLAGACGNSGGPHRGKGAGPAVVIVDKTPGGAPISGEVEPNDSAERPQLLAVPGAVRGTIGGRKAKSDGTPQGVDVDRFAFELKEAGSLRVVLSGIADADLVVELTGEGGRRIVSSDNGPAGTAEGFPDIGLGPGSYRLVVREFIKGARKKPRKGEPAPAGRQVSSAEYLLEVAFTPAASIPAGDEREPNETAAFATPLPLPGVARGYAGWRKDRDVYRVPLTSVPADEALTVDVDGVAEVALRVSVLDGTEAILLERQGKAGDAITLRNVAVRSGEPAYFVVVAASGRGNLDDTYLVHVATAPVELDEESEPNDTVAQAGPLADVPGDGGMRVGDLPRGDTDVYALDPGDVPRLLHLVVEPPAGVDVDLAVLDDKGQPVGPVADAGKLGATEKLQGVEIPATARRYVRVRAKQGGDTQHYRLRWSAVPAPIGLPGDDPEDGPE